MNRKAVRVIRIVEYDNGNLGVYDESPDGKMTNFQWMGLLAAALLGSSTFNHEDTTTPPAPSEPEAKE